MTRRLPNGHPDRTKLREALGHAAMEDFREAVRLIRDPASDRDEVAYNLLALAVAEAVDRLTRTAAKSGADG